MSVVELVKGNNYYCKGKRYKGLRYSNFELDIYLITSFEFGDRCTVLDFPILSIFAKQILATLMSIENKLLVLGCILDETHSSITVESIEAQTCVDDWTKPEQRRYLIYQTKEQLEHE